jgi:flagellar secretion chaperone FliS
LYETQSKDALLTMKEARMLQTAAARYERVKTSTASKGELLLALYEGLFRFLNGARVCFEQGQLARGRELVSKAHAIISELQIALDPKAAPELCAHLDPLYSFCLDHLRDASASANADAVGDVVRVLSPLRDAWVQAVPEAARQGICNKAE